MYEIKEMHGSLISRYLKELEIMQFISLEDNGNAEIGSLNHC